MKNPRVALLALFLSLLTGLGAQSDISTCPLRFRVTLAKELAPEGAQGRLLVFMATGGDKRQILTTDFVPGSTRIAAEELERIGPGEAVAFDPDVTAYPRPFSTEKPGSYEFMALLDPDHSLPYTGMNGGDLYSAVVSVSELDPAKAGPITLVLDRKVRIKPRPADTETVKYVEMQSQLLTAFWGRPIWMRAGVVLPSHAADGLRTYPAVYHVHGFGGDYTDAWSEGPRLSSERNDGGAMVHVFLDGSFPTGHHEFADSVNNGPWGKALTTEFIPWLENRLPLIPQSYARFLTGHSSGGWSTLWLQVTYPDAFGGTWSTSPDPVDFRSFTGIDVSPGSTANAYQAPDGSLRPLVRQDRRVTATLEQFVRQEVVQGEYGGQFASFEWVFSPKGPDGRPMKLFNRATGVLDPAVQQAWHKYDIRAILEEHWADLEPKLRGKIHVICGAEDTFYLNEAVALLRDFCESKRADAVCELIPGRDHFNLYRSYRTYPDGLEARIEKEMQTSFQAQIRIGK
jgi:hypothetical protein